MLDIFFESNRAGIYPESLIKYYQYPNSFLRRTFSEEFEHGQMMLWQKTKNYLLRYGEISKLNEDFLYAIYFSQFEEMFECIRDADIYFSEKIVVLLRIIKYDVTREMFCRKVDMRIQNMSRRNQFVEDVREWVLNHNDSKCCKESIKALIKQLAEVFMKKRIVFWTHAYNAEKTIARAIESVLNQTYKDFIYYILDNGSTDKTGEIICEYSEKDSRIIPLKVEINGITPIRNYVPLFFSHCDEGYMAIIDADDEYKPEFLEHSIAFAEKNNLDMVLCGCDYIENGERRTDIPKETLIIENEGFEKHFPAYYKYSMRYWGILFSSHIILKNELRGVGESGFTQQYGIKTGYIAKEGIQANSTDAFIVLRAMQASKRIGLLAKSCYTWYIPSGNNASYIYTPNYFWWVKFTMEQVELFLLYYGKISKENYDFLMLRYLIWLQYILPRIQKAEVSTEIKLHDLFNVFSDRRTKVFLALDWKSVGINTEKEAFLKEVCNWAESQKHGNNEDKYADELIELLKEHSEHD
jgi:glycosyltransferase involved in cell wall biosynthesis